MSTEENFDDLLKSKLEGAEFTFNEANWDKAEALILAADKKRKRKRIAFIFFIGLILGVCFMIPFTITEGVKMGDKFKAENEIKIDANIKNAGAEKTNSHKTDNLIAEKAVENEIDNNKKHEIKTEDKTKNKAIDESKIARQIKAANKNKSNAVTDSKVVTGVTSAKNESVKVGIKQNENVVMTQNGKNDNAILSKNKVVSISENNTAKTNANNKEVIKNKSDPSINSIAKTDKVVKESNSTEKDKLVANHEVKKNVNISVLETKKQEENVVVSKKNDSISIVIPSLNNIEKDTTVALKDSVTKTKVDSNTAIKNDENNKANPINYLSIDAGANYAFGWKNNAVKEAVGFNAVLGVSVTHFFSKKWSGLIGLQYTSLAHLNYSNYTSNNTQYDFGYNQTKTIITPTIIHYLAIPLKLQYWFNDKNSLSLGINALYLLNTNSKVETDTRSDFSTSTPAFTTKKGYRDGFTTFDLQPALTYRRKIYKAFNISAEVYYGLIDIKNNTTFGLNKAEHNSGLKLTLSYNILHK